MFEEKIISIVNEKALRRGVSVNLILALIEALSACAYAMHYEPLYRWTLPQAARPSGCNIDTELMLQRSSIGLVQVKGAWAREQGFDGWLTELTDPERNIDVACARVAELMSRYEKRLGVEGVISAYGAVTPRRTPDGEFVNQGFVNKVMAAMARIEKEGRLAPVTEETLMGMTVSELKGVAEKMRLELDKSAKKGDIIYSIITANTKQE